MHIRDDRLDGFDARWLAEVVRLREQEAGPLGDADAVREARRAAVGAEARIVARARHLGARHGLLEAMLTWRARARMIAGLCLLLALLVGLGAALAVIGDGQRPINVLWALGGLLGVHLFSLAVWLGGMWYATPQIGGLLGQSWLWLVERLPGHGRRSGVGRALVGLYSRAGLVRWWLGLATHGMWALALAGALFGLLMALSLRSYGFVWETTILPADTFVRVVALLGWLPELVGFHVPDEAAVRASGNSAVMEAEVRQAWSSWLIGCMVMYGLLPRLLLLAWCAQRLHAGRRAVRLDLSLPGYALLVQRLAPESERIGVTDAAPVRLSHERYAGRIAVPAGGAVVVGVELRPDFEWPPAVAGSVFDGGVLDSREQRARMRAALEASPPARLLIVCDPRLSPDRGSLNLIADLAAHAATYGVWLAVPAGRQADGQRLAHWREGLTDFGLETAQVFEDEAAALSWLRGEGGDAS